MVDLHEILRRLKISSSLNEVKEWTAPYCLLDDSSMILVPDLLESLSSSLPNQTALPVPRTIMKDSFAGLDFSELRSLPIPTPGPYIEPRRSFQSKLTHDTDRSRVNARSSDSFSPAKAMGLKMWSKSPARLPYSNQKKFKCWHCAVCMYDSNESSSNVCVMCNNPKDFRSDKWRGKQCPNCTYMNGELAFQCEMCDCSIENV